jgi:hypothetical protein
MAVLSGAISVPCVALGWVMILSFWVFNFEVGPGSTPLMFVGGLHHECSRESIGPKY